MPTFTPTPTPTPTPIAVTLAVGNKLQEGDRLRVRMTSEQIITQGRGAEAQVVHQNVGYEYTYTVREVGPGENMWIDVHYAWILFEQEGPLQSMRYDSSDPPEEIPPELWGYHALVGKGFSLLVSPQGEVLEIAGLDDMIASVVAEYALEDEALKAQLVETFESQFGEEALRGQLSNVLGNWPQEPARIGQSWTESVETPSLFPMFVHNTYTLASYDGRIALIQVASTMETNPEADPLDMMLFKIAYDLSGDQEGAVEFDTQLGWMRHAVFTQFMSGTMTVITEEGELSIPMTLEATTVIELVEQENAGQGVAREGRALCSRAGLSPALEQAQ
jgi:hypothetical protein